MNEGRHFNRTTEHTESLRQQQHAEILAAQRLDQLSGVNDPQRNRILAALPRDVENQIFPFLDLVSLPRDKVIHECGQPLSQVFFPIDSIASLLCVAECGSTVEVAMVGNEGIVGFSALLGGESNTDRAQVLRAGHAYVLPADRLGKEFDNSCELRMLLLRYMQSLFAEMAQTAFCNRHHSIRQQFSRWLLMSLDRHPSSKIDVTQEMIANTLGVRVASISEVASKLQKLHIIEYHRGKIIVLDRLKLEKIACKCHAKVKNDTDGLDSHLEVNVTD